MGRPPKIIGKLTRSINLKLSEMDYVNLLTKAERLNITPTAYARQMVVNGYVRTPYTDEHLELLRKIGAVPLTEQQRIALDSGESVCFKDRTNRQGEKFDVYAIWSTQENQLNFFYEDPCRFGFHQQTQQEQVQPQSHTHEQQQSDSFISGGLGLLDLPNGNGTDIDDIENEQMTRNLNPKKKRGRSM